jgi:hypothetical protein
MSNPQQPELRRSETTPGLSPDSIAGELKARKGGTKSGNTGPVPKGNTPGRGGKGGGGKGGGGKGGGGKHRVGTDKVSDKPDLDDFAEKLGIDQKDPDGERAHEAAVETVQQDHEHAAVRAEERAELAEERADRAERQRTSTREQDDDSRGLVGKWLLVAIGAVGIGVGAVALVVPKTLDTVQRLARPLTDNRLTRRVLR